MPEKRTKQTDTERQRARQPQARTKETPIAQYEEPDKLALQRTVARPALARPEDILALQRSVGNRAVRRLVDRVQSRAVNPGVIQRHIPEPQLAILESRDDEMHQAYRDARTGVAVVEAGVADNLMGNVRMGATDITHALDRLRDSINPYFRAVSAASAVPCGTAEAE